MHPEYSHFDFREKPEMGLTIEFSQAHDIDVVTATVSELALLKEQGYSPNLPEKVIPILDGGMVPTQEEIDDAIGVEFRLEEYTRISDEVAEIWAAKKEEVLANLSSLGFPIQSEYVLRLTKYGVGGEYHVPNVIDANIQGAEAKDVFSTIVHEAIHLTIEKAIEESPIDHWAKERIVDLIFGRFYPERVDLQRDPEHSLQIGEIFERYYPDIQRVISEISRLGQGE